MSKASRLFKDQIPLVHIGDEIFREKLSVALNNARIPNVVIARHLLASRDLPPWLCETGRHGVVVFVRRDDFNVAYKLMNKVFGITGA